MTRKRWEDLNPYYAAYVAVTADILNDRCLRPRGERQVLVTRYSWAVPSDEAIKVLCQYSPLIEIGAGTGYWASLIASEEYGGDIVAFDKVVPGPDNPYHRESHNYYPILLGGSEQVLAHPERTLFLCWPPYETSFAYDCLSAYEGEYFIYVGEPRGGCTADDRFFEKLAAEWEVKEQVDIPQWYGMHDYLTVYHRKL